MDLPNKSKPSLAEDLEVSSSDEEMEKSILMNEGWLRAGAAGHAGTEELTGKLVEENQTTDVEVEDGEIVYPNTRSGVLALNKSGHRPEIVDIGLDEICRQRNIHAPPKRYRQQSRHGFQHDRQAAGARNKFYNIDPRENVSRNHETMWRSPLVGVGRDHQRIRRRHHYPGGHGPHAAQQRRNEKLKKGVQSVTQHYPESANPILKPSDQTPEGYPEFREEPWHCISRLINKGFSINTDFMKLKNDENLSDEEESRLYRCLVSYKRIQGICEASNGILAKHGAAVDFLRKLSKIPYLGRLPEKVNEALLVKRSAWGTLSRKMKEKYGDDFRFWFENSILKVNNHTLFKSALVKDNTYKYEACSYLNEEAAKSIAVKMAYEDLLKEKCPFETIYLGVEQCTIDRSLYRDIESHNIYYYDISGSIVVDATGGPPLPRREECIPVSYVEPVEGPWI